MPGVMCEVCDKTFSKSSNLKRHYKNVHNNYIPVHSARSTRLFKCPICKEIINTINNFNIHLFKSHQIELPSEQLSFRDENEFSLWKATMEDQDNVKFIKTRGQTISKRDSKTTTFYCNRSGYYRQTVSPSERKRHMKIQGSSKIGAFCPSRIKAVIKDGKVTVDFFKKHIGHDIEMAHIPLPNQVKKELASKIEQKIPFEEILTNVEATVGNKIKRKHLLTKKDLQNIVRKFSLYTENIHNSDDALSVEAWVEKEQASESNSVLLYKPNGVHIQEYPGFEKDDFMLAIMTDAQTEMLKKYGSDIICIDFIHGKTAISFDMTILLVIDDMRQGFPCAFYFSNRNDCFSIELFLKAVKGKVGNIKTKVLMSDLVETFYKSWRSVMGEFEQAFFCTWHVQHAWLKKLKNIKDLNKRREISKVMFTLQYETDTNTFEQLLPLVLKELCEHPDTVNYGHYFATNFMENCSGWAYCYRENAGINTNMHLERLHEIFKHFYLKGRVVKRLGLTIKAVMGFLHRNLFDSRIIHHTGNLTRKIINIIDRHKKSVKLTTENVWTTSTSTWIVFPSSTSFDVYTVSKSEQQCNNCSLLCKPCNACIHKYNCTCIDSCVKWNMCRHIHLVCQQIKGHNTEPVSSSHLDHDYCCVVPQLINNEQTKDKEMLMILQAVSINNEEEKNDFESLKNDVRYEVEELLNKAQTINHLCTIKDALKQIHQKLDLSSEKSASKISVTTIDNINARRKIDSHVQFKTKRRKTNDLADNIIEEINEIVVSTTVN